MKQYSTTSLGFSLMILWCLITAFSHVFISYHEQNNSPLTFCFYTFFIANIIFIMINFNHLPSLKNKIKNNISTVIQINLLGVSIWLTFFYALKYIEPAIVGSVLLGIRYLSTNFFNFLMKDDYRLSGKEKIIAIAISLILAYLCYRSYAFSHNFSLTSLGLACTMISGISLAYNTILIKQLSKQQFSPLDVLSIRFLLLISITGMLMLFFEHGFGHVNFNLFTTLIIASTSLIIIPQVLLQNAIHKLEPISVAIIAPFMPIITFFLEFFDNRLQPSMMTIIALSSLFLVISFGTMIHYRLEKQLKV